MARASSVGRPRRKQTTRVSAPFGAQTIMTAGGEDLVVLARAEFDALLAATGNEEAEVRAADRIVRASRAAIESGEETILPAWLAIATARGEAPLKVVRLETGRTQQEIADRAGVSQTMLSLIESGAKRASADLLSRLAKALNVDPAWLEPVAE